MGILFGNKEGGTIRRPPSSFWVYPNIIQYLRRKKN
ncbi:MAG: hypothetical protein ACI8ZM_000937 [Crocinitomix sp.]|jgi:hypothetical protein